MGTHYESQRRALNAANLTLNQALAKGESVREEALMHEILLTHDVSVKALKDFLRRYANLRKDVVYENGVLWLQSGTVSS
jgi:hypothetical protein